MDIHDFLFPAMRQPYHDRRNIFDLKNLMAKEPYGQFKAWFGEACKTSGILEPNAMTIATATK